MKKLDAPVSFTESESATVGVDSDRFVAFGIKFVNTAGPENHQAVAFRATGDQSALFDCAFEGSQDTLYVDAGRQYYKNCYIGGSQDFIFGDAAVVIDAPKIQLHPSPSFVTITASGRAKDTPTGIVIRDANIAADSGTTEVYLGRPWKKCAFTVFINANLPAVIEKDGWLSWNEGSCMFLAEAGSTGPGASSPRADWVDPGIITDVSGYDANTFTEPEMGGLGVGSGLIAGAGIGKGAGDGIGPGGGGDLGLGEGGGDLGLGGGDLGLGGGELGFGGGELGFGGGDLGFGGGELGFGGGDLGFGGGDLGFGGGDLGFGGGDLGFGGGDLGFGGGDLGFGGGDLGFGGGDLGFGGGDLGFGGGDLGFGGGDLGFGGGDLGSGGGDLGSGGGDLGFGGGDLVTGGGDLVTSGGDLLTGGGDLVTGGGDLVTGEGEGELGPKSGTAIAVSAGLSCGVRPLTLPCDFRTVSESGTAAAVSLAMMMMSPGAIYGTLLERFDLV
ncbi:unnamed protein product [Closterium sp. Yama58-4]|nr:unnamed protein product [Closterium sp. Yama58-4]